MPDDLKDAIRENATGPQSAATDGVNVRQHSLRDQIEADKHLANKEAQKDPVKGFTRVKIVPPGTA
jgi:hypothetical protein